MPSVMVKSKVAVLIAEFIIETAGSPHELTGTHPLAYR